MYWKKIICLVVIAVLLLTGCAMQSNSVEPESMIDKPEKGKLNLDTFDNAVEFITEKAKNSSGAVNEPQELHSFIVLIDGERVYEKYVLPKEDTHELYSASKSFLSTAVGIAVDEGLLSVEDEVSKFFPEYTDLFDSDYKKQLKIKHLLSYSSGFEQTEEEYWFGDEPMKYFFSLDIIHEPGTHFYYEGFNSFALSYIITKLTGMSLHDYLYEKLFKPLGIEDTFWDGNKGVNFGAFGLSMKPNDLVKIGQLYLDKGLWEGKRYISEEWVVQATNKRVETNDDPSNLDPDADWDDWQHGYGYNFWMCSFDAYRADGHNAQFILVFPEENMVIVTTASISDSFIILKVIKEILLPNLYIN